MTNSHTSLVAFPGGSVVKIPLPVQEMQETRFNPCITEDPLEEEMATHSNILAWEIPWTEEPGRLWSTGSQRVNLATEHACMPANFGIEED